MADSKWHSDHINQLNIPSKNITHSTNQFTPNMFPSKFIAVSNQHFTYCHKKPPYQSFLICKVRRVGTHLATYHNMFVLSYTVHSRDMQLLFYVSLKLMMRVLQTVSRTYISFVDEVSYFRKSRSDTKHRMFLLVSWTGIVEFRQTRLCSRIVDYRHTFPYIRDDTLCFIVSSRFVSWWLPL